MASGSGYRSYLLRRMGLGVSAVDNVEAAWGTIWVEDTVKANGVEYLPEEARGAKIKCF
jgi:hypothetical protein